jgi:hypothetical protein
MTQREQNGNCFCSKAAMRQQQSLRIFCDTFFLTPDNLADLDHTTSRVHNRVIVPAFDADGARTAEPVFESPPRLRGECVPKAPRQKPISANKRQ